MDGIFQQELFCRILRVNNMKNFKVGQIFALANNQAYVVILAQVAPDAFSLIHLDSGNRHREPIKLKTIFDGHDNVIDSNEFRKLSCQTFCIKYNSMSDMLACNEVEYKKPRKVVYERRDIPPQHVSNFFYDSEENFNIDNPRFKFVRFVGKE